MPRAPVTATVRIKRPRADVHALLSDLSRHEAYLDHFLVDWTMTSEAPSGPGAAARVRAAGGGGHAAIEVVVIEVADDRIVEQTLGGRGMRRRMRLVYALADVANGATQVELTLELLAGSALDRATWSITRTHLERQYGQGMLRLKGLLEAAS
jgi:uncharacterized protein YndB with AHSA1/START domain